VFNGEIYNYREVATLLRADGVNLKTDSDTEVLLESLLTWGWDALNSLEGMWAFAAFDARDGSVALSRDRFGEKPLFYQLVGGDLSFGSDPTQIETITGRRLKPNLEQVERFLALGYRSLHKGQATFFQNLSEVQPGTTLFFSSDGTSSLHRYWMLQTASGDQPSFAEAVSGVRDHLYRSVDLRLRSDVPLAFSLSGGVDSVALASIASSILGADVHGFTIRNTDPRYSEADMVETAVKHLGISHTWIDLDTTDFTDRLRTMVVGRGAPVITLSSYVQNLLMQCVSQDGYRVVVGGTAADEVFSGYYDHHLLYIASISESERSNAVNGWNERLSSFVRNPFLQTPLRFVENPGFRDHLYLDAEVFAGMLLNPISTHFEEVAYHPDLLRNRMMNELLHESIPILLGEEDLNAMAWSIENRSPFLDRGLVEYVYSLPTSLLIQRGYAKALLREAVRGVAPNAVLDNPRKVGFNAPIEQLMNFGDKNVVDALLSDSPIFDVVRRDRISQLLGERGLRNSQSKFLFNFVSSKAFLDAWS
jgi:asparagine synthase (glutamine-hydrolysing)